MRFIGTILALIILISIATLPTYAESTVQLSGASEYSFEKDGLSTVVARYTLINLDTNTYPAVFFLELPDDAFDVIVFDEKEPLEFSIVEEAGQKKAKIRLGDDAVGVKAQKNITISYKSYVFAILEDGIWQVYIPPFTTFESLTTYRVSVSLPETWNQIIQIDPEPSGDLVWVFDKDPKAISIAIKEHGFVLGTSTVVLDQNMIMYIGMGLGVLMFVIIYILTHLRNKK